MEQKIVYPHPDPIIRLTISRAEVAQILGMCEGTFANKRTELEEEAGFPKKIPGTNKWSRPAIEAWFLHGAQTHPSTSTKTNEAALLEAKYGGAVR